MLTDLQGTTAMSVTSHAQQDSFWGVFRRHSSKGLRDMCGDAAGARCHEEESLRSMKKAGVKLKCSLTPTTTCPQNSCRCGALVWRTQEKDNCLSPFPSRYTLLMSFSTFVVMEYLNFNHGENKGSRLNKNLLNLKEWNHYLQCLNSVPPICRNQWQNYSSRLELFLTPFNKTRGDCWLMQTKPFIPTTPPAFRTRNWSSDCLSLLRSAIFELRIKTAMIIWGYLMRIRHYILITFSEAQSMFENIISFIIQLWFETITKRSQKGETS